MTVKEALKVLNEIAKNGGEELELVIPYKDSKILGASPCVKITYITKGFDWDSKKVFCQPEVEIKKG